MESNAFWIKDELSLVDNGRDHSIGLDLPVDKGGGNKGPTALELMLMGLAGCITTIFAKYAKRNELEFSEINCHLVSHEESGRSTFSKVTGNAEIKTENKELAKKTWIQTLRTCPVGLIFKEAHIEIDLVPVYI